MKLLPDWRPSASLETLRARARLLARMRQFFAERGVLEVETPLLCHATVTTPFISSIPAWFKPLQAEQATMCFLQTSPEYAMKRLLAAGTGPIYQICKAFRQGEVGRMHNPEFTMLEWYRPGYTHFDLMDEVDSFLQTMIQTSPAEKISYADIFYQHLGFNPHEVDVAQLAECANRHQIAVSGASLDKDSWLDILWTHCIEPKVGFACPLFVYDFPASQAALAKIQPDNPPVAARFEVYLQGVELANGFYELQDAEEQKERFAADLAKRQELGLPSVAIDQLFLQALCHGLPDCAGVAIGIDRLLMIWLGHQQIADVISFDFPRS